MTDPGEQLLLSGGRAHYESHQCDSHNYGRVSHSLVRGASRVLLQPSFADSRRRVSRAGFVTTREMLGGGAVNAGVVFWGGSVNIPHTRPRLRELRARGC